MSATRPARLVVDRDHGEVGLVPLSTAAKTSSNDAHATASQSG